MGRECLITVTAFGMAHSEPHLKSMLNKYLMSCAVGGVLLIVRLHQRPGSLTSVTSIVSPNQKHVRPLFATQFVQVFDVHVDLTQEAQGLEA